jgi:hypothetical protein
VISENEGNESSSVRFYCAICQQELDASKASRNKWTIEIFCPECWTWALEILVNPMKARLTS